MQNAALSGKADSYQGPTGSSSAPTNLLELHIAQLNMETSVVSSDDKRNSLLASSVISGYGDEEVQETIDNMNSKYFIFIFLVFIILQIDEIPAHHRDLDLTN
jgi:hypothetical protein